MEQGLYDEKQLLQLLEAGNPEAYKRLFEMYYTALVLFAHGYVKEVEAAQDLVQDVFCELWNRRRELGQVGSLRAWLYILVRNRCLNRIQHHKVEEKYLKMSVQEEEDFFLQRVIEEEVYRCMKEAIDELPPKMREVFVRVLDQKTNAQIAGELEMTEEAVKAYRKRGMKALRGRLKHLGMFFAFFLPVSCPLFDFSLSLGKTDTNDITYRNGTANGPAPLAQAQGAPDPSRGGAVGAFVRELFGA